MNPEKIWEALHLPTTIFTSTCCHDDGVVATRKFDGDWNLQTQLGSGHSSPTWIGQAMNALQFWGVAIGKPALEPQACNHCSLCLLMDSDFILCASASTVLPSGPMAVGVNKPSTFGGHPTVGWYHIPGLTSASVLDKHYHLDDSNTLKCQTGQTVSNFTGSWFRLALNHCLYWHWQWLYTILPHYAVFQQDELSPCNW